MHAQLGYAHNTHRPAEPAHRPAIFFLSIELISTLDRLAASKQSISRPSVLIELGCLAHNEDDLERCELSPVLLVSHSFLKGEKSPSVMAVELIMNFFTARLDRSCAYEPGIFGHCLESHSATASYPDSSGVQN